MPTLLFNCGCDLLSDLFFTIFKHNRGKKIAGNGAVVICFQICSLRYLNTMKANMLL